ncbi:MAG: hypothetical protein ACLP7P_02240 [Rhodomicrobium sp.]
MSKGIVSKFYASETAFMQALEKLNEHDLSPKFEFIRAMNGCFSVEFLSKDNAEAEAIEKILAA